MSSAFTDRQRTCLAALADVLIPASDTMPSASQAGVAGHLLDGVLSARDDLTAPLAAIVDSADVNDPVAAVARLRAEDPEGFDVLAFVVAGGYLMDRRVGELLDYPFQEALQVDPYDYMAAIEDGLLTPVIERGPIYRPTPQARLDAVGGEVR